MTVINITVALCDGHGMLKGFETKGKRTPEFPAESGLKSETGNFMFENEFNRAVVKYLDIELKRCGFKTLLVAPTDADTPLPDRVKLANDAKVDFYLSVHANALLGEWGTHGGIETFAYNSTKSQAAAKIIHKQLLQGTPLRDRGVKDGSHLYVLKNTTMPAVLVECAFMDNLGEAKLLLLDSYRRECATELAKGVCEYFGVAYKAEEVVVAKPVSGITKERVGTTDVYWLKLEAGTVEKADFIYKKGAKVSQITKDSGADFGINFPYFYNNVPLGDSEDSDVVISAAYGKMLKWHEFAFVDGKPVIGQLNVADKQDFLVQGAPLLIENGKLVYEYYRVNQEVQDDIGKSSAQRTFVGVDAKGALIIAIAEGRTTTNKGLTLKEMAEFMLAKGAIWALNGDGGGSTTLATKGGAVVNQNSGSNERVTNHAIVFYLKKPQEATKLTKFNDVPAGIWYEKAVKVVSDIGIMSGDAQGNFNPTKPLTRAEMAAIIAKLIDKGMIK